MKSLIQHKERSFDLNDCTNLGFLIRFEKAFNYPQIYLALDCMQERQNISMYYVPMMHVEMKMHNIKY